MLPPQLRDLHPLEILSTHLLAFLKFICIFEILLLLTQMCAAAHAEHTHRIGNRRTERLRINGSAKFSPGRPGFFTRALALKIPPEHKVGHCA